MSSLPRAKIVVLGSLEKLPETLVAALRSLNIEHVSPAQLMRQEISRRNADGLKAILQVLSAFRRWYWTRKPDAGFLLTDYPATLLQALVLDEWLEARCEALDLVLAASDAPAELIQHYRNLGLLCEAEQVSAQ